MAALLISLLYLKLYDSHDRALITSAENTWFQSDLPRSFSNMTDRRAESHYRAKVHPLHSLESYVPAWLLRKLGLNPYRAVQVVSAGLSGIWFALMFLVLRAMGCARVDSWVFAALGICSSAAMFWLSVPETYALGSISILACLWLSTRAASMRHATLAHVAVSSFSLSVTVTNWMAGLAASLTTTGWRRTFQTALFAFALVAILWGLQKYAFPHAVFFLGDTEETSYVSRPRPQRLMSVVTTFFFHTLITPAVQNTGDNGAGWNMLSVQTSSIGSSGLLGLALGIAWSLLLAVGAWSLYRRKPPTAFRNTLVLVILGQLALHAVYGEETFLYSLHFLPLLVCLGAAATLTRLRKPAVALAAVCVPALLVNNGYQFAAASRLAISPRTEVLRAMADRPDAHWPRGTGHVVLAAPGSEEKFKAYHEPGGGFSPSPGSLGISVWLFDAAGKVVTTSDDMAGKDMMQSFAWPAGEVLPQIATTTPHYGAIWQGAGQGAWQLKLRPTRGGGEILQPSLMVRSVGPAGGAIRELAWDGTTLLANKRWSIEFQPAPKTVRLGREDQPSWPLGRADAVEISSPQGWAFARIELDASAETVTTIRDALDGGDAGFHLGSLAAPLRAGFAMDLPDERFARSLDAQIAHLMMGLVRAETRPGEPTNYPLAWQRDGAYVLAALARAGKTDVARRLARDMAQHDFFGGFGPEADAPGLGIWSLVTTADILGDAAFDAWLWPHVQRKAEFIDRMLVTGKRIRINPVPPIVPAHVAQPELDLVAEPARDGLIVGRMDHHRPLLFINAVSYGGMLNAASLARRTGHPAEAQRWQETARALKRAWEAALPKPEHDNDRTYISALWPSGIGIDSAAPLKAGLQKRWLERHSPDGDYSSTPLWTYFELAEAHQWLYLGDTGRTWSTLEWFWQHQSSPGLYTWWEGSGEENSFGRWASVRGWVRPQGVSPHYWTAAEMALLQLDMLAHLDPADDTTLVIGAGVPAAWLDKPSSVKGLPLQASTVDWAWDAGVMRVWVKGSAKPRIRLGPSFPPHARVEVSYLP